MKRMLPPFAFAFVALAIASRSSAEPKTPALPDLPGPVTSFGAAVAGDAVYVYGGHVGEAHSYSNEEQAHELWRLNLKDPRGWETLSSGPHLQGLALVAHDGKLYRVGGFTAKNAKGEEHDLWSQDDTARFDPAKGEWEALPPLPEPRSSHDAAVVGDKLYVVGGWQLRGDGGTRWHKTAYAMDLTAKEPRWEPLPAAPFQRRAVALAAHDGRLYVLGGMRREGGPTTRVDIFDPASGKWSRGPDFPCEGRLAGFGCAAFATGGRLYASTIEGDLLRLSKDGSKWEMVRQLEPARFFHRMLPLDDERLLILGGANMSIGKFDQVNVVEVK